MDMGQYKLEVKEGKTYLRKKIDEAPAPTEFDLFKKTTVLFAPKVRSLSAGALAGTRSGIRSEYSEKQTEELRRREDMRDLGVITGDRLKVSPRAGGYLSGFVSRGGFRRRN